MVQLKKSDPFADFTPERAAVTSTKDSSEPIRQLHVLVPISMQTRLRIMAAERGMRMSEFVREILEDHIAKEQ